MPKIKYENLVFRTSTRKLLEIAGAIVDEYQQQGFALTLRQLYYQLVARGHIPNKVSEYDKLGIAISKARRAGLIDWDAIVDRTRFLRAKATWDNPAGIVSASAQQFRIDLWQRQPWRVEVWFEKDALLNVFERAVEPYRVPCFSCRGYVSDSELWGAAQRLHSFAKVKVLHFGDHDPSGLDMTRDIGARLALFGSDHVQVKRCALTMEQVRRFNPPPNPAKETDSRFEEYKAEYGDESWEVDALEPKYLHELVQSNVRKLIEWPLWEADLLRETGYKEELQKISSRYDKVARFVRRLK